MREDEVYFHTKEALEKTGLKVVAGQPPRGTDRVPVIEVKTVENQTKGSRGSFKPDLVAANEKVILIVECKPTFSVADVKKLRELRSSVDRRRNLAEEIMQRGILHRHSIAATARNWQDIDARLQFAVSYHGKAVILDDLFVICINSAGSGSVYLGGQAVTNPWSP